MASVHPDIKPNGLNQRELVALLYMIVYSLQGICAKLDDDGGVTDTDYEANVFTAIFNGHIEDHRGNAVRNIVSTKAERSYFISPTGISDAALIECLYDIFDMIETLTEQLDADATVNDTTYEALCYTALLTWIVENQVGNTLGNGTTYYFRPGGPADQKQLVDLLYQLVNCIETLTEQLDADGGVTDITYESLLFTATVLLRVENSQGNVVGNDRTDSI
jgi:hypothetical protein